jgi:MoaA/NifB/PqqE/SkfB family radical SAM enzyme
MSCPDYREVLRLLTPHLESVSLGCIREPLVHPQIKDLIRITDQSIPGDRLSLSTNGLLLDKELVDELIATRHAWQIIFSIESCNPETYARIRRGARFEFFHKNLTYLISAKKTAAKDIKILFSAVIFKTNLNEYSRLLDYADALGVDFMTPMRLQVHDDNADLALSTEEENKARDILLEMTEKASRLFTKMDLSQYSAKSQENSQPAPDSTSSPSIIMNHLGYIYPPGFRKPLGCIFKPEDRPSIFKHYNLVLE